MGASLWLIGRYNRVLSSRISYKLNARENNEERGYLCAKFVPKEHIISLRLECNPSKDQATTSVDLQCEKN